MQIVLIKGVFSGGASVVTGFCIGERITSAWSVFAVLAVGFVAYGLSIFFYVHAQRRLGAARTGAYYAIAPFIGTALSLAIFRDMPDVTFFIALAVMLAGAWLCASAARCPARRDRRPTSERPKTTTPPHATRNGKRGADVTGRKFPRRTTRRVKPKKQTTARTTGPPDPTRNKKLPFRSRVAYRIGTLAYFSGK